jgi:glyceraldehyde 3-phosphate dehydrogenase
MIKIGINGFGRIGKSVFLQAIKNPLFNVMALNIPDFNIKNLPSYLLNDSSHKYDMESYMYINNDNNSLIINNKDIPILNQRNANKLDWKKHNVDYLIETSGKFLTIDKAKQHDIDYFIACAPSKDNMPQFLYNGNHNDYNNESIISNASCTTNCIVPLLKVLNDIFKINHANFITVHAATASQQVIDNLHHNKRIHRSIFNNIIPHTTGASKSICKILPELNNKIYGTSVRIPTSNVSMVDINVSLDKKTDLGEIFHYLSNSNEVEVNNNPHLVSSDFMTTTCPTIVDVDASMDIGNNTFKFTIWYDNEWSYSAQVLKMVEHMYNFHQKL